MWLSRSLKSEEKEMQMERQIEKRREKVKIPEISSDEQSGSEFVTLNKESDLFSPRKRSKSAKGVTECPHAERKHYAKNMCYNCYHNRGRNKCAWKCGHKEKRHYAKGLCQNCYHSSYKESNPSVVKKAAEKARAKLKLKRRTMSLSVSDKTITSINYQSCH
jgi:hypothetical protein